MKLTIQFVATPTTTVECECVHHDALTCIAEKNHTTRFNASIVFATGCERNGRCACLCHQDAQGHQVSEEAWQRARAKSGRRIPRRANQSSEAVFVAAPRRDRRGQERARNKKGQYAK